MKKIFAMFVIILTSGVSFIAQSGGNYQIVQSVTGNSGETSSGGVFSLTGTSGQTVTEQSSQAQYNLHSGFWLPNLVPTASSATVGGRVFTPTGRGLGNAFVVMTDQNGVSVSVRTNQFGYYRFNDVRSGETYVFNVQSKRYQFATQVVSVDENLDGLNFYAQPQG